MTTTEQWHGPTEADLHAGYVSVRVRKGDKLASVHTTLSGAYYVRFPETMKILGGSHFFSEEDATRAAMAWVLDGYDLPDLGPDYEPATEMTL